MRRFLSIILIGTLALGIAACAKEPAPSTAASENTEVTTEALTEDPVDNSDDKFVSAYPAFKVTSESLDGKYWVEACAYEGENVSPQLSWEPVEGATTYVIYMVDLTAYNIIHWKSEGITETNLPQGWASSDDYTGPRPPSGSTNQYNIYVFALKAPVERVKGSVRAQAVKLQEFMDGLDTDAEGNTGNIVAVGRIIGYRTGK
ncbi:MAG: hypothetical protein K5779_06260 [Saccharofermentans sp.]|nr:hypothetical protein [Saccharofermentans sp.]